MRKLSKFKVLKSSKFKYKDFPLRILKLKKTKWKISQILLKKKFKLNLKKNFKLNLKKNFKLNLKKKKKFLKKKKKKNFNIRFLILYKTLYLKTLKKKTNNKNTDKKKRKHKKKFLLNFNKNVRFFHRWEKRKLFFKKNLSGKNFLKFYYDNSFNIKNFIFDIKKEKLYKANNCLFFVRNFFQLDILLWNLHFFTSVYESRFYINNNLINVNFGLKPSNYILKNGDVISFLNIKNTAFNFNINLSKISKISKFFSFIEVDMYTKTILIIKNFDEIDSSEISFFMNVYVDPNFFRYY